MHTARHLKHSTYLCGAAVVGAAVFGPLAAVPFAPPATVLWWLAIKATWNDDAPRVDWVGLFAVEMICGLVAGIGWCIYRTVQWLAGIDWEAIIDWKAIREAVDDFELPRLDIDPILAFVLSLVIVSAMFIYVVRLAIRAHREEEKL
jgi:hypothetical protein